jgi:hypothetical protein
MTYTQHLRDAATQTQRQRYAYRQRVLFDDRSMPVSAGTGSRQIYWKLDNESPSRLRS